VRTSDLRLWNEIPYGRLIRIGEALAVWVPEEQVERFEKIESLSSIDHKKISAAEQNKPNGHAVHLGTSWATHSVKKGDTIGKIAKQYGVSKKDIQRWNGLRSQVIKIGQELEILLVENGASTSSTAALAQKDSSKAKKAISYRVKKGDTLHSIASAFGVSIDDLREWNNIRGTRIRIGQALVINS
jgi:LysM repeat protein